MRLKNRNAVITGSAQGIGAACGRRFALEGARVMLCDVDQERGAAVAADIRKAGGEAWFMKCDVSSQEDMAALVQAALKNMGSIDACVCAAGIAPNADFLKLPLEEFERVLQINLYGPMILGQLVAREMVARGKGGAIVNVTSTSTRLAGPLQASYCASKGGLDALTRAMALALAPHNIRVNALAPGPTKTGLAEQFWDNDEIILPILSRTPLGRFADPDEQATVAAFLASDDASFMTGETVYVDGGRSALNYTVPVKPGQR
jgi:glucose 1-dehydrogenase